MLDTYIHFNKKKMIDFHDENEMKKEKIKMIEKKNILNFFYS